MPPQTRRALREQIRIESGGPAPARARAEPKRFPPDKDAGPEKYAAWYRLLQKVENENKTLKTNEANHAELTTERLAGLRSYLSHYIARYPEDEHSSVFAQEQRHVPGQVEQDPIASQQMRNPLLPVEESTPPFNESELTRALGSPNVELAAINEADHQLYNADIEAAHSSEDVMFAMAAMMDKYSGVPGYRTSIGRVFDNLPPGTPALPHIRNVRPGICQGYGVNELANYKFDYVDGVTCFKYDDRSVSLPHFAGIFVVRGSDKKLAEARAAALGAAMFNMRSRALAKMDRDDDDGYAHIFTFLTDGRMLEVFVHHVYKNGNGDLVYHQYPIEHVDMTTSLDAFRRGVELMKNCQREGYREAYGLLNEIAQYYWKNKMEIWRLNVREPRSLLL